MITSATLITRYPEFTAAYSQYPDMISGCVDQANAMIDYSVFGAKAEHAAHALAAHYIAINPLGEFARLDKKGEKTIYWLQYEQIKRSLGAGFRVI